MRVPAVIHKRLTSRGSGQQYARLACSARRIRSASGSSLLGSTSISNFSMISFRAGAVSSRESCIARMRWALALALRDSLDMVSFPSRALGSRSFRGAAALPAMR